MLDKPLSETADARPDRRAAGAGLAVLIVGMHRSGTSALSGVLNMLGVAAPEDLIPADEHNTKGYFEPERIINFHEALLKKLGSPSNDPLPLSYDWVKSPLGDAAAVELADILDEEFGDNTMCLFKDPRICRLVPVWTEALARAGRPGVAVLPLRHPLEVAGSLLAKGGLARPYALCMWLQHVLLGERFTRAMPRSFAFYDALMDDWRSVAGKLQRELGVAWPRDLVRAGPEIDGFLSRDMRHHASRAEAAEPHDLLEGLCARAWTVLHRLNEAPHDAEAMAALDAIWAEFEAAYSVFGALVVSYQRELDAARGQLHSTRSDAGGLISRLGELEKARASLRHRLDAKVRDLDWAMQGLRDRDAEIERRAADRDDLVGQIVAQTRVITDLRAIEASTSWKLVTALGKPLRRSPALRRLVRGTLTYGWWILTFKLGRKLRERDAFLAAQAAGVAAGPAPEPPPPEPESAETVVATIVAQRAPAAEAKTAPHVVFLSGEPTTPGHTYRVDRYAEAARAVGATTTTIVREDVEANLAELVRADLLFIWRAYWDDKIERAVAVARAAGAKVLFDVDDLLMEPDLAVAEIVDGIRSQKFTEEQTRAHFAQMEQTFRAADYCSAPTEFLAHRLRRHGQPAFVLPNGFDDVILNRARLAARRRRQTPDDGLVRIGYAAGSKTHQKDFGAASEAVADVLRAHPKARLVLFRSQWGDVLDVNEFPAFDGLLEQIEWRDLVPIQDLPDELARFDVNLAPLEVGNIFCESKSELKFFEAALAGVATVASPTGPFRKAMRHGETGFLANSVEEWREAIEQLVADPALRARMAQAARFDALAEYGPEYRAEAMTSLLEQTLKRGRPAARAFELDLERGRRPRAPAPFVPPHTVLFELDRLRPSDATVVVPLYNYAHFVEEALDSVAAQTAEELDLIVVDDGSTDDSLAVARRWIEGRQDRFNRVLLIRNVENAGLAFTRNVGFANAETPFVLPLDADNVLEPTCVETLVAAARETGAAFAYPQLRQFGDVEERFVGMAYDPARFVIANYIDAMALIRRAAWAAAGGYDHVQYGWEDYDFWCRLVERGMFGHYVDEPLAGYRVHGSSMLRSETDTRRNKLKLVRDIERRHPWLHIDRSPPGGPSIPEDDARPLPPPCALPAPVQPPRPNARRTDGASQTERLARLLPLLRDPETRSPLVLDGEVLKTAGGTRTWPVVLGRPHLFDGLGEPGVHPANHISNPLPDRALDMIEATDGMVLNLSAGGTERRYEHVVEAEVAVFRHTDVIADVHALPFADASFDLVVSMNAFERCHSPRQAADEIMRVLRPGGQVLIRTAFLQPLHEAPWHLYNTTRYGLERWFERFDTLDLQVSDNFNPAYALSWQLSEAEAALRRELGDVEAERLLAASGGDLVRLWRDPAARDSQLWKNFFNLSQAAQEQLAAGFEYLGRKPE